MSTNQIFRLVDAIAILELTALEDVPAPIVRSSYVIDATKPSGSVTTASPREHDFLSSLHLFALPCPSALFSPGSESRNDEPHAHDFILTDAKGNHRYCTCLRVPSSWVALGGGSGASLETPVVTSTQCNGGLDGGGIQIFVDHFTDAGTATRLRSSRPVGLNRSHSSSSLFGARNVTCFCFVSRFPMMETMRKCAIDLLVRIKDGRQSGKLTRLHIEDWLLFLANGILLPPPDLDKSLSLVLPALNQRITVPLQPMLLSLPGSARKTSASMDSANSPPTLHLDVSCLSLFDSLSTTNVFAVLSALFFDHRVLVVSCSHSLIVHACETLRILLRPFDLECVYAPVIPESLADMLEAPTTFFMGAHRSWALPALGFKGPSCRNSGMNQSAHFRDSAVASSQENLPGLGASMPQQCSDVVVVDLDTDTVHNFPWAGTEFPWSDELQTMVRHALGRRTARAADSLLLASAEDETRPSSEKVTFTRVQGAFLHWAARLLGDIDAFVDCNSGELDVNRWMRRFEESLTAPAKKWIRAFARSGRFLSYIRSRQSPDSVSLSSVSFERFREAVQASPKWASADVVDRTSSCDDQELLTLEILPWKDERHQLQARLTTHERRQLSLDCSYLTDMQSARARAQIISSTRSQLAKQSSSPAANALLGHVDWLSGDLFGAYTRYTSSGQLDLVQGVVQEMSDEELSDLFAVDVANAAVSEMVVNELSKRQANSRAIAPVLSTSTETVLLCDDPLPVDPLPTETNPPTAISNHTHLIQSCQQTQHRRAKSDGEDPVPIRPQLSRLSSVSSTVDVELTVVLPCMGQPSVSETLTSAGTRSRNGSSTAIISAKSLPASPVKRIQRGHRSTPSFELKRGLLSTFYPLVHGKTSLAEADQFDADHSLPPPLVLNSDNAVIARIEGTKIVQGIRDMMGPEMIFHVLLSLVLEFKSQCALEYGSHGRPKAFVMADEQRIARITRSPTYQGCVHAISQLKDMIRWEQVDELSSTERLCVFANLRSMFLLHCISSSRLETRELERLMCDSTYLVGGLYFSLNALTQAVLITPRMTKHLRSRSASPESRHRRSSSHATCSTINLLDAQALIEKQAAPGHTSPILMLAIPNGALHGPMMQPWHPEHVAQQLAEAASEYVDRVFVLEPEETPGSGRHVLKVPEIYVSNTQRVSACQEARQLVQWIVQHLPETRLTQSLREKELIKPVDTIQDGLGARYEWRISKKLTVHVEHSVKQYGVRFPLGG